LESDRFYDGNCDEEHQDCKNEKSDQQNRQKEATILPRAG